MLDTELPGHLGDPREGLLEVGVDIDRQSLQRAQVDHLGSALDRLAGLVRAVESVDRGQESRERLARAGGGADQRVPARDDRRPPSGLGLGRPLGESAFEPSPDRGMKRLEDLGPRGNDGRQ